jgi:hypothetical protein
MEKSGPRNHVSVADTRLDRSHTRLRWTFKPAGDLFIVYNHDVRDILDRWQLESNQLSVTLQCAFRY